MFLILKDVLPLELGQVQMEKIMMKKKMKLGEVGVKKHIQDLMVLRPLSLLLDMIIQMHIDGGDQ